MQLIAEDNVLDEHGLHLNAPTRCDVFDNFADGLCNLFATLDDVLQDAGTDNVAKCSLCALDEGLANVRDPEGGFVRRRDVVVDDGGEVDADIVFGHAYLLRHLDDLNLDIDLYKFLRKWIDLDQAGIDSAVKATKLGDETDITLGDRFVGVRTDETAWNSAAKTNTSTESIN